ncbi:hypothetical protein PIB30_086894 [Stylosanthes scabra]|uniref:TF-B3 domain-containing protein n=1 Tax=Stylosanthes scabra TaxID=79078 RepID=A0ABU6YU16_9FABA|nr:hypothetical protein [Stylosanthes scabra]
MKPEVGLIYDGFKDILKEHNINRGGIMIATYHGSSIFRFKIAEYSEEDLLPYMISNVTYYCSQPIEKTFQMFEMNGYQTVEQTKHQFIQDNSCETLFGFPVVTTKNKKPMLEKAEVKSSRNAKNRKSQSKRICIGSRKLDIYQFSNTLGLHLKRPKGWPCYLVATVDGMYVVEKPVRDYHLTQHTMNVPRQLLDVAFSHNPTDIIVIVDRSKTYNVRVRNKHKRHRTMVLGRGCKKFQLAHDLRKGDVIRMSFDPKRADYLKCAVIRE